MSGGCRVHRWGTQCAVREAVHTRRGDIPVRLQQIQATGRAPILAGRPRPMWVVANRSGSWPTGPPLPACPKTRTSNDNRKQTRNRVGPHDPHRPTRLSSLPTAVPGTLEATEPSSLAGFEHPEHEEKPIMATDCGTPRVTESDETDTSPNCSPPAGRTASPHRRRRRHRHRRILRTTRRRPVRRRTHRRVILKQADEFTCTSRFLVHHRSRLADSEQQICRDCA
jgi:hypothetical protein